MQNRRSKKLVQPGIQLSIIGSFLAAAIVCVLTQAVAVNLMIRRAAAKLPNDAHLFFGDWPALLTLSLIATLCVLVPLMVAIGLRVTHRLVGPLNRLEKALQGHLRGEAVTPVRVRKSDYLFDLSELIDQTLTHEASQQGAPQQLRLVKDEADPSSPNDASEQDERNAG